MPATVTEVQSQPGDVVLGVNAKVFRVLGDNSYPTAGYAVSLPAPRGIVIPIAGTHTPRWNPTTGKMIFLVTTTGVEVANLTDLSVAFVDVIVA